MAIAVITYLLARDFLDTCAFWMEGEEEGVIPPIPLSGGNDTSESLPVTR